jgi:hypothetical protein
MNLDSKDGYIRLSPKPSDPPTLPSHFSLWRQSKVSIMRFLRAKLTKIQNYDQMLKLGSSIIRFL